MKVHAAQLADGSGAPGTILDAGKDGLRVVYISGYSETLPCSEAESATEFLPKPFTPDALVRKVRQALDR